jgi:SNF family Na+-dependent transporter
MHMPASCGQLLVSWVLFAAGMVLIGRYEHVGFLLALLPLAVCQKIRVQHDRLMLERCRESRPWQVFALLYYAILLIIVAVGISRGVDFVNYPLVAVVVAVMLPFLVAMAAADRALCMRIKGSTK